MTTLADSPDDGDTEKHETFEEMNADQMRNALTAIAQEVQQFLSTDTSDDLPEEVYDYKSKLQIKRKQIKILKENLNTACTIAKTMMSAKENEHNLLSSHLALARDESVNLLKKHAESIEIIQRLKLENHILNEKVQNLNSFIELGFAELQKIRNRQVNDLPILMQLKEIMVSCGQYYADYCNEHEKYIQLEQKNRYLTNKLNILETNLGATTDDLKQIQKDQKVEKKKKVDIRKMGYVRSEYKFGADVNVSRASLISYSTGHTEKGKDKIHNCVSKESLDLSSHMSLVKNLLSDQDTLLNDLRKLTTELGLVNF